MSETEIVSSSGEPETAPPKDYGFRGYHPEDGYIYGWLWNNGDYAWWSTRELAERHPGSFLGPGKLVRRAYQVGEIEWAPETDPEGAE